MELTYSDRTLLNSLLGRGPVKAEDIPLKPATRTKAARKLKAAGLLWQRKKGYYLITVKGSEVVQKLDKPKPVRPKSSGRIPVPADLEPALRSMGIEPGDQKPQPTFSWVRYLLFWGAIAVVAGALTYYLTGPQ